MIGPKRLFGEMRAVAARATRGKLVAVLVVALSAAVAPPFVRPASALEDKFLIYDPRGSGGYKLIPPNPEDFVEITAGDYHTCARKNNGNVYCWGLASGPSTGTFKPTLFFQGAKTVDAGSGHTCALNTAGAAYCWGAGNSGQLGFAFGAITTANGVAPVVGPGYYPNTNIPIPPLTFTSISAGGNSTCGTTSGGVYCWGEQGTMTSVAFSPQPALISTYNGMTSLAVGGKHSCGYLDWAREVYCWNGTNYGQAGQDPAATYYYPGTSKVIFAMSNGLGTAVARVSAGGYFTCADQLSGIVQCFGHNNNGQLGNGTSNYGVNFVPQTVGNGRQLHGVSAGTSHACALDVNNQAWCWGFGMYGQLGEGSVPPPYNSATPVPVQGGRAYRAIAAGLGHTCAIATDNKIYCWGQLDYGQLGIGPVYPPGYYPWPVQALDP
jgi:alpha-tubulin suppressor-like RCC1 family protein